MKPPKYKTKLVLNIIKSASVAFGLIALLSIVMIAGSVSRPFAVFFNENIPLFSGLFAVVFIAAFFTAFIFLLRSDILRIDEIRRVLFHISDGDYGVSTNVGVEDEIGLVGEAVNNLVKTLDQAKQSSAALEKRKKELIANISHDLRTPLTSILGYMELIAKHKYSNKSELGLYAEVAYSKGMEMKLLIDDLFEYSKLDNNDVFLKKQNLNINEFLSQVLVSFVPEFSKAGITYNFPKTEEKNYVDIDCVYYRRVFENILSNAVSYGQSGSCVDLRIVKEKRNVIITINSDKPGISDIDLSRIFERNYKSGNHNASSGLGLAIVKQIVDMHGDKIEARIEGGKLIFEIYILNNDF